MSTPEEFLSKLDAKSLIQLVREASSESALPAGCLYERFRSATGLSHEAALRLAALKLADEMEIVLDDCHVFVGEDARRTKAALAGKRDSAAMRKASLRSENV